MRLPIEGFAGRALRFGLALILVPALAACGSHAELASAPPTPPQANGPSADYPVVIGQPYKVGDTLYTPVDTMNFDEVGYVAADRGMGVTGAHHTLPLPSYVEVTSLVTGHTILVRLERRGPMDSNSVIALSPAALAQLGASPGDPVRVRRVNPPEDDRAALRAGRSAPARMGTPASLVAVLKQKLPAQGSANLAPAKAPRPLAVAAVAVPPSAVRQSPRVTEQAPLAPASAPPVRPVTHAPPPLPPLPTRGDATADASPNPIAVARQDPMSTDDPASRPVRRATSASDGAYIVQAAAMSTLDRAQKVAGVIGGSVSRSGQYYRVRTGPFATREQAEASLAKVRAAGYSDARIFNDG